MRNQSQKFLFQLLHTVFGLARYRCHQRLFLGSCASKSSGDFLFLCFFARGGSILVLLILFWSKYSIKRTTLFFFWIISSDLCLHFSKRSTFNVPSLKYHCDSSKGQGLFIFKLCLLLKRNSKNEKQESRSSPSSAIVEHTPFLLWYT
jgi:hypothetical protein